MTTSTPQVLPLAAVNALPVFEFIEFLEPIYGSASWVPVLALEHKPFLSIEDMAQTLSEVATTASPSAREELINLQPDFLKDSPHRPRLEQEATARLDREQVRTLTKLQLAYQKKFGFPLILSLYDRGPEDWEAAQARLEKTREEELAAAFEEIGRLLRLWLREKITS